MSNKALLRLQDVQTVARYCGLSALIPAGMGLLSAPLAWSFGEKTGAVGFLMMSAISLATGGLLYICGIRRVLVNHYQIFWIISFSWLVISLLGTVPFMYVGAAAPAGSADAVLAQWSSALFESVSGFTTTGLTMVAGREAELGHSLQWWRSFSQWIGGIGIIMAVMMFIFSHRQSRAMVHVALGSVILRESVHETALRVWAIYTVYTVVIVGLLIPTDMGAWQAVNYGMTAISTGGFGVTGNSLGDFSRTAQAITMLGLILGALSFAAHQRAFTRQFAKIAENSELRWFLASMLILIGAMFISDLALGGNQAWPDVLFQSVTSLTTAGFSTGELSSWSLPLLMLIILAMVIGGCEGSAAGGIKISRFRRVLLELGNALRMLRTEPEAITDPEVVPEHFELDNRMLQALFLTALWVLTLITGVFLLSFMVDAPLLQIIFDAVSALGIVGLSSGLTQPDLSPAAKGILTLMMWLGRLEIIPILAIVLAPFYLHKPED